MVAIGVSIAVREIGDLDPVNLLALSVRTPRIQQGQVVPLAQGGQDLTGNRPRSAGDENALSGHGYLLLTAVR